MPDSRSRVARPVAAAFTIALLVAGCSGEDQSSEATVAVDQSSETTAPVDQRSDVTTPASPATTEAPAPVTDAAPSITAEGEASPSTAPTRTEAPTPTVLATVPEQDSVFAVVQARDDLSKFAELLVAIDAPAVFQQARGLTLLAPNDAAWDAYGAEAFQALLDDPTAASLVLSEHLMVGSLDLESLVAAGGFANAMARTLPVTETGGKVTVGGAEVVEGDLSASNGEVHVIDAVIPPAAG